MLSEQIALVLAAAFTGAALYISIVEQPARLGLDDRNLLREWKPRYAGGFAMQGSLAVASGAMGLASAWLSGDWRWVVGAALILANWPYTLLGMMPMNIRPKAVAEDQAGPRTRAMILQWGRLHAVRTGLGFLATAAYLWATT